MGNRRNSNIELARIICMIGIVLFHLSRFDSWRLYKDGLGVWQIGAFLFSAWGCAFVSCFIAISAWFLYGTSNKKLDFKKVSSLLIEVTFVAAVTLVIKYIAGEPVGIKQIIKCMFSAVDGTYWYVLCYVVLLLIYPMLNMLIDMLNKEDHVRTCFLLGGGLCCELLFTGAAECLGAITLFILVYFVTAYMKKYRESFMFTHAKAILIMSFLGTVLLGIVMRVLIHDGDKFVGIYNLKLINRYSPFMFLNGVSLFATIIKQKNFYSKVVNWIAKYSFGIYLIHANCCTAWVTIFGITNAYISGKQDFVGRFLLMVLVIILLGLSVDMLAKTLVNKVGRFRTKIALKNE